MFIIIQKKKGKGVNGLDYPGNLEDFEGTESHPTLSNKWVTKVGNNATLEALNSKVDYEVVEYIKVIDNSGKEREWRNNELLRTDYFMTIPDYPEKALLTKYRVRLRDYPTTVDFPDGERPTK